MIIIHEDYDENNLKVRTKLNFSCSLQELMLKHFLKLANWCLRYLSWQ